MKILRNEFALGVFARDVSRDGPRLEQNEVVVVNVRHLPEWLLLEIRRRIHLVAEELDMHEFVWDVEVLANPKDASRTGGYWVPVNLESHREC